MNKSEQDIYEIFDIDIDFMSLVELGANYTQVEDGKTILLMKSAKRVAQENSDKENKKMEGRKQLESEKKKLELALKFVAGELSKLSDEDGEVGDAEKPEETADNAEANDNTDNKPDDKNDNDGEDLSARVKELEGQVETRDKEIATLSGKLEELLDVTVDYWKPKVSETE